MAGIEEIPIESADIPGSTQEIQEDIPNTTKEIVPDIQKRGRGRPAGAKNKPKPPSSVAAAKPKTKAKQTKPPIEYEVSEADEEEEPTPPRRRTRKAPASPERAIDRHALASDVLNILQQQRYERRNARRNHYASWFNDQGVNDYVVK